MIVSKATKHDLIAVQAIDNRVTLDMFNKWDVALQARLHDGSLIGFIWAGVVAKGSRAIIAIISLSPTLSNEHTALRLVMECEKVLKTRGIKHINIM